MLYHGGTSIHVVVQLIAPRKYSKIDKIKTTKCMGTSCIIFVITYSLSIELQNRQSTFPFRLIQLNLHCSVVRFLQHFYHPYQFAKNNYDTWFLKFQFKNTNCHWKMTRKIKDHNTVTNLECKMPIKLKT